MKIDLDRFEKLSYLSILIKYIISMDIYFIIKLNIHINFYYQDLYIYTHIYIYYLIVKPEK